MKNIPANELSEVLDSTKKAITGSESDAYTIEPTLFKGKSSTRRYVHDNHIVYQLLQPSKKGDTYTQALISVPTEVGTSSVQSIEEHAHKKENVILTLLKGQLEQKVLLEHYLSKDGQLKNLAYMNSSPLDFQAGVDVWENEKHQRVVDILDDPTYDLSKISKKEDRLFHPVHHA